LVISLVFSFWVAPVANQLGQEPEVRVLLAKNPEEFNIGGTDTFYVKEAASGKVLYEGKGELFGQFSDSESMSFSIFIDTFYTHEDAELFASAMQTRFTEEIPVSIRADGELFRLEMGKYKTQEEAQEALDTYFGDIPSAVLVASVGFAIKLGEALIFRPPTDREYLKLVNIESSPDGYVKFKGRRYRGTLTLSMSGANFYVVNNLMMENYLRGVVPVEVSALWPIESVKAQAVAARTYALKYQSGTPIYTICSTDACQVYRGVDWEHKNSDGAIVDTLGTVAVYEGELIGTYFHSTSGGMTENSENVWASPRPYLKAVSSPGEEASSRYFWTFVYTDEEFTTRIQKATGIDIGYPVGWKQINRGASPRVMSAVIVGTKSEAPISGSKAEYYLNLHERWFDLIFIPGKVVINGHGWGHGVGMSQYGARARALEGMKYQEILKYYYKGIDVVKWY